MVCAYVPHCLHSLLSFHVPLHLVHTTSIIPNTPAMVCMHMSHTVSIRKSYALLLLQSFHPSVPSFFPHHPPYLNMPPMTTPTTSRRPPSTEHDIVRCNNEKLCHHRPVLWGGDVRCCHFSPPPPLEKGYELPGRQVINHHRQRAFPLPAPRGSLPAFLPSSGCGGCWCPWDLAATRLWCAVWISVRTSTATSWPLSGGTSMYSSRGCWACAEGDDWPCYAHYEDQDHCSPSQESVYVLCVDLWISKEEYDESGPVIRSPQVLLNYVRNFKDLIVFKLKNNFTIFLLLI